MTRDAIRFLAAQAGAQIVGGPSALPFSLLANGARFYFPKTPAAIHVKVGVRRYRDTAGSVWQTGRNVAVIPVRGPV